MKKTLLIFSGIFGTSLITTGLVLASQQLFSDVNTTDWFYEDVKNMVNLNVIKGYEDGTFRPGQPLNRAELAAILNRYDKNKIYYLQNELIILRSKRTNELASISDWQTFYYEAGTYPATQTIPPSYNKMGFDWTIFDYDQMGDFEVLAIDNVDARPGGTINEILVHKDIIDENTWEIFHVRMHFSSGSYLYGPFYGNLNELTTDINENYFDPSKPTDPESLKV
jgi:hypothetical protein